MDSKDDIQQATREIVRQDKIHTFQDTVERPFLARHKENILCQHWPWLILVTFPVPILPLFPTYGGTIPFSSEI